MAKEYKNPARYRLDFIKENTFNRVWTLHMTRTRVILVSLAVVAGTLALLWVIMAYTPMRGLLPGALRGDLRGQYLETALRLDSLEQAARINSAYLANIVAVMTDDLPEDSVRALATEQVYAADSLLAATEAEKRFVESYRQEERFNLSVLAPIAAEGMIFGSPVPVEMSRDITDDGKALEMTSGRSMPVTSVYRGTVISTGTDGNNRYTVTVQHPNDFVSIYTGLGELFVAKGKKVSGGQALGQTAARGTFTFELWHNGSALNPTDYLPE